MVREFDMVDHFGESGHNSLSMRFGAGPGQQSPFYRRPSSFRGGGASTSLSCSSIPQRPPSPPPPPSMAVTGDLSPSLSRPLTPEDRLSGGFCSPTLEFQSSSVFDEDNSELPINNLMMDDESSSRVFLLQPHPYDEVNSEGKPYTHEGVALTASEKKWD